MSAADPSDENLLSDTVSAAKQVASDIRAASDFVQTARQTADGDIARQVNTMNAALADIRDLNIAIQSQLSTGGDAAGLMDQRQRLIDQVSSFVPVREVARPNGKVAVLTLNGATLVDDNAARLEFQPTGFITADMTLAGGALSGIGLVGAASSPGDAAFALAGGSLEASFRVRDELAPGAQAELDAYAEALIGRTADPNDPAIAGLFSDGGGAVVTADLEGLAGRIHVNAAFDPAKGGSPTALRDGVPAPPVPTPGDPERLNVLRSALNEIVPYSTSGAQGSALDHVTSLLTSIGFDRQRSEVTETTIAAKYDAFRADELAAGVDTDDEMQKLLQVEKSYAANARLIQTIDEMLQALLRL